MPTQSDKKWNRDAILDRVTRRTGVVLLALEIYVDAGSAFVRWLVEHLARERVVWIVRHIVVKLCYAHTTRVQQK